MNLVERVQRILLKPREEWSEIKEEPTSVSRLFTTYAAILAGIPAVAQFIGYGLIGFQVPYKGWITYGIGMAFFRSILLYIFTLALVYGFGFIINVLAPNFSSSQNSLNAMKLAVYSMTPYLVGSIFYLVYPLRGLVILASLYGIYLLYLGITTPLMDTPKEKVFSFLVVNVVVATVLMAVANNMLRLIFAVWAIYRSI